MREEDVESLWQEILFALGGGKEEVAIPLARRLSELGDWRGSSCLGYIDEVRARRFSVGGKQAEEYFRSAASWYRKALLQGENYAPHYGLAAYHYYGLGGQVDFKSAYEHLEYCVDYVPVAKIMMAELLFRGLGASKDVKAAKSLLHSATEDGYPAALVALSRIEKSEKHYFRSAGYYLLGLCKAIKLVIKNKEDPLLAGVGKGQRTFRLRTSNAMSSQRNGERF